MRVHWYDKAQADMQYLIDQLGQQGYSKKDARAWVLKNTPLEKAYQRRILDYLKTLDRAFYWKVHSGGFQNSGVPDICLVYQGQFFAFEVKRPYGLGHASDLQTKAITGINNAGGKAYIVSYVDEVKGIIEMRCANG